MISIILATYNEKENIIKLIKALFKHCPKKEKIEVIVVDDNSPDGTHKVVKKLKNPRVKVILRKKTKGLASAFNRGIIESQGDHIAWMDADMCMPPEMIPKMYDKIIKQKYDVVIGSRYAAGGIDDRSFLRKTASQIINGFAGLVLGYGIKDYDSGFVMIKRQVLDEVSIIPTGYGEYFIEFVYNICQKGFQVREVGYYFRDRTETEGKSKSFPNVASFLLTGSFYVLRIIHAKLRFRK